MIDLYSSDENTHPHSISLKRLDRAIALSQGQFCLIFACCNSVSLRSQIVKQLPVNLSGDIYHLFLQPSVKTLYTTMQQSLQNKQPDALMILGLESVISIEQLLTATNFVRDDFRKDFAFPIILWVNDEIMQKLVRLAPDFKNWAASTIRFQMINEPVATPDLAYQLI
ncbi:hypothetical protein [Laspinema olomoucense]|uniref:hypothetical protein n=1 Tax=Laspinema olomoucense TaxID=3231600 RepID=UPI0021BB92C7|nr:hypothetical protein [Laspinema sp. D3d]MCT7975521.1 hypothetical protein [Laspinema sp. D3d]